MKFEENLHQFVVKPLFLLVISGFSRDFQGISVSNSGFGLNKCAEDALICCNGTYLLS